MVDVSVADTLFVETQIRRGWGGGVAGALISVGEGVDSGWIGRRVVTFAGAGGGYAERSVVRAEGLIPADAHAAIETRRVIGKTLLLV